MMGDHDYMGSSDVGYAATSTPSMAARLAEVTAERDMLLKMNASSAVLAAVKQRDAAEARADAAEAALREAFTLLNEARYVEWRAAARGDAKNEPELCGKTTEPLRPEGWVPPPDRPPDPPPARCRLEKGHGGRCWGSSPGRPSAVLYPTYEPAERVAARSNDE